MPRNLTDERAAALARAQLLAETTDLTWSALSRIVGVPRSTIYRIAKAEGWAKVPSRFDLALAEAAARLAEAKAATLVAVASGAAPADPAALHEPSPFERSPHGTPHPSFRTPRDHAALVKRLWRAATRQVGEIERDLAGRDIALADRERVSRTLASVVKTVQELRKIDDEQRAASLAAPSSSAAPAEPASPAEPAPGSPGDRDLRRRLAERIAAFGGRGRS